MAEQTNGNGHKKPTRWSEEQLVQFTPEQVAEACVRLNNDYRSLDKFDADREQANGRIRDIRAEIEKTGRALATGGEKRMVTVEERPVFERNTVEIVNIDTQEVVRERPMTGEERAAAAQGELPITPPLLTEAAVSATQS